MGFLDFPPFLSQLPSLQTNPFPGLRSQPLCFPIESHQSIIWRYKLTDTFDPSTQVPFDAEAALRSGTTPEDLREQSRRMEAHASELQRFFMDRQKQKKPAPANENSAS